MDEWLVIVLVIAAAAAVVVVVLREELDEAMMLARSVLVDRLEIARALAIDVAALEVPMGLMLELVARLDGRMRAVLLLRTASVLEGTMVEVTVMVKIDAALEATSLPDEWTLLVCAGTVEASAVVEALFTAEELFSGVEVTELFSGMVLMELFTETVLFAVEKLFSVAELFTGTAVLEFFAGIEVTELSAVDEAFGEETLSTADVELGTAELLDVWRPQYPQLQPS